MRQMAQAPNNEQNSNISATLFSKKVAQIVHHFKGNDVKLVFQLSNDEKSLTVRMTNGNNFEQYYEDAYSYENLSIALLLFQDISSFYQYLAIHVNNESKLEFSTNQQDPTLLKITIIPIQKRHQMILHLGAKKIPEIIRQSKNLKSLEREAEKIKQRLKDIAADEQELNNKLASNQQQIQILVQENQALIQELSIHLQTQLAQYEKTKVITDEAMNKKKEIMALYFQLVKSGYQLNEKQKTFFRTKLCEKTNNGQKKIQRDDASDISIKSSVIQINEPAANHELQNKQIIIIDSSSQNIKGSNQNDHQARQLDIPKQSGVPKIENINSSSKKKLQINDNESLYEAQSFNFAHNDTNLARQQQNPLRQISPSPPQNPSLPEQKNNGANNEQFQKENKKDMILVLSSQQNEDAEVEWTKIGNKINLDFTSSQHIHKYQVQVVKGGVCIERIFDDNNFYQLVHKNPITDNQSMQITILNIFKKDFTFGIMAKNAVKISRLQWSTKTSICWVGCADIIFPNRINVNSLVQSDHVTVSVDSTQKIAKFFLNKKLIYSIGIPETMMSQCYFFIETATKGNKFSYKID